MEPKGYCADNATVTVEQLAEAAANELCELDHFGIFSKYFLDHPLNFEGHFCDFGNF